MGFPGGSAVKNAPANTGDLGLIPGSEKSCDKGNDNPPQDFLPRHLRGAWQATVHGVTKESDTS